MSVSPQMIQIKSDKTEEEDEVQLSPHPIKNNNQEGR